MKILHYIAFALLVIGGLNWGLVGVFDFNLVEKILGSVGWLEKLVYILVGLAGVWEAITHAKACKYCGNKPSMPQQPAM